MLRTIENRRLDIGGYKLLAQTLVSIVVYEFFSENYYIQILTVLRISNRATPTRLKLNAILAFKTSVYMCGTVVKSWHV